MINWETIKSLYNDKPTLLEWLKKVEAALSGATLTSVSVNTISVGVITLTFEFDDGTSITTPNINLPQGAQGVSITGASIVAGKLILTLSNGTTIDAGNTGAVLGFEIDSNQHLIVKYQDGTSEDLGAIFTGNVNITGDLSVGGTISSLEKIVDANGNRRFLDISPYTTYSAAGVTITYCKASLSGSHLMVVCAGNAENGVEIPAVTLCSFVLPSYIADKIVPFAGQSVAYKDLVFTASNLSEQTATLLIIKTSSTFFQVKLNTPITLTNDRTFRAQFDLIIDLS